MGAWIGLNASLKHPELVKSFVGYGNLAPMHKSYHESILEFARARDAINNLVENGDSLINESNWFDFFKKFYLTFFFPEILKKPGLNQIAVLQKFSSIMFPQVQNNSYYFYKNLANYFCQTILEEGKSLSDELTLFDPNVPLLFLNGDKDMIATPQQTIFLHEKIYHSKIKIIKSLGHGSLVLGKGLQEVMRTYLDFLESI